MSEDMLELFESYCTSPYKLGDVGEIITAYALRNDCKMQIVRSLYLPSNEHLTEIDIVGISPLGVFVIENKNYKATIVGKRNDYYWKVKYSNSNFERLYNPIMQNEVHREAVKRVLKEEGYLNIPVYNVVIFNDKGILDLKDVEKSVFSLSSFVKVYNSVSKVLIDEDVQGKIYSILKDFSNISIEAKYYHVSLLRSIYEKSDSLASD